MSRTKAFWPKSADGIRRPIPGLVNGLMLDAEVDENGIRFYARGGQTILCMRPWSYVFSLDEQIAHAVRNLQNQKSKPCVSQFPELTPERLKQMSNALHGTLRILPAEED